MYTFQKFRTQYLRILDDGTQVATVAIKTLGREAKSGYVEVTDGNRLFLQIKPSEVSGATTTTDVLNAIKTAITS